jgi:radical SAM superfamily enzyme YgiQ (UPF0313 family)
MLHRIATRMTEQPSPRRRFCIVLVKPSHYDDDGYVIQWLRSAIPSNSLAALYALAEQCARQRVLGDDVDIELHAFDETNLRVRPDHIAGLIKRAGSGVVFLVGVQSNQFPRALDIARPLRARGIMVAVGGFHVSGTIALLDGCDPDVRTAEKLGVALFAGEAENRLAELLRDAGTGQLKPLYNFMNDLPSLEGAPGPILPAMRVKRTASAITSFDAGRGCPFQCSFCTIINVQGRKSRRRSASDIEEIVRTNVTQGLFRFFITDDNFARNKDWEEIVDRLIALRREPGFEKIVFIIQVDTLCHRIPNFVDKCARAGIKRVFIGLENINPDSLLGAKKRQNKITEYRKMLLAWKDAGVITYAGYILGFPNDTVESIIHDIEVIKKELPIDLLEFFFLTPLPGSEDHLKLYKAGVAMDRDMNRYDLNHSTTAHPRMTRAEWERAYRLAWDTYYSVDHVETILRRAAAKRLNAGNILFLITWFKGSFHIEKVHPLESGFFRMKFRRDRRSDMPIEPAWLFYPKFAWETLHKQVQWLSLYLRLRVRYLKIKRDPNKFAYTDLALSPVTDEEVTTHELFQSDAAQAFLAEQQRIARAQGESPSTTVRLKDRKEALPAAE